MMDAPQAKLTEITRIDQIRMLAWIGFNDWGRYGDVTVKERGDLLLFKYNRKAITESRWNYFEQVSRGLIVNRRTGQIVARPFDKFFNWGEGGRMTTAPIKRIWEKLDGSCGVFYQHAGERRIATLGSFDGEQAQWATEFLNTHYSGVDVPAGITLVFEIIYPGNRVVVDYGDREALVLLAARNIKSGAYVPIETVADVLNMELPRSVDVTNCATVDQLVELVQQLPSSEEGYVAEFEDESRFKFKGPAYLELAKIVHGLTFDHVVQAYFDGRNLYNSDLPEELRSQVEEWVEEIYANMGRLSGRVEELYQVAPKATRKEFALWVKAEAPQFAPLLFARADDRELAALIRGNYGKYADALTNEDES